MKFSAKPVVVDAYEIEHVGDAAPVDTGIGGKIWPAGSRRLLINNHESGYRFTVTATAEMLARMTPVVGDFWVVQSDGYAYVNPRDVFLRKYELIGEEKVPGEGYPNPTMHIEVRRSKREVFGVDILLAERDLQLDRDDFCKRFLLPAASSLLSRANPDAFSQRLKELRDAAL